jgi:hypothetical protein
LTYHPDDIAQIDLMDYLEKTRAGFSAPGSTMPSSWPE